MKVKVTFEDTTVVVPCGSGDEEVRAIYEKAAMRYKRATGKGDGVTVEISALHTAADNAVVDADDIISDVLDDKDLLIAIFTVHGDTGAAGAALGSSGGARRLGSTSGSNGMSSNATTPSPFSPTSLSPSPSVEPCRSSSAELAAATSDQPRKLSDGRGAGPPSPIPHHFPGDPPGSPQKSIRAARPQPPATTAPGALPHSVPQYMTALGSRQSSADSSASSFDFPTVTSSAPNMVPLLPARSPKPSRQPQPCMPHDPAHRRPSPPSGRHSAEQSVSEHEEEEDEFGGPPGMMHRNVVQMGAPSRCGPAGVGTRSTRHFNAKPPNYLISRWQQREEKQQEEWENRLQQQQGGPVPPEATPSPTSSLGQTEIAELESQRSAAQSQASNNGQELADVELSCRSENDQLGIVVRGYRTSDNREIGVFVHEIRPGSIAAENGLVQLADRLVRVNGVDLTELSNNQALTLFHTAESEGMLRLRVSRAIGSLDDQPDSPSPSPPPPRLPPIPVGTREAYHREQQQQQQLQQQQQQQLQQQQQQQQEEVAAAISEGGTAALDAVQPTAVPATPVQIQQAEESASAAEQVKQRGVLPATNTLPAPTGRRVFRKSTIVLEKGPTGGLGFSVTSRDIAVGDDHDRPVFVRVVTKGGVAYRDGRLKANDRLLEVNGTSLTGMTQKEAVQVLKMTSGQVTLTIYREEEEEEAADDDLDDEASGKEGNVSSATTPKVEHKAIEVPGVPTARKSVPTSPVKKDQPRRSSESTSPPPPPLPPRSEKPPARALQPSLYKGQPLIPVKAPKTMKKQYLFTIPLTSSGSAGLGISVKGKTAMSGNKRMSIAEQGEVGHGIYIKAVLPGGAAAKDGRLLSSDRLVSINGENLSSLSDYDAFESLRLCMAAASQRPSINLVIERRVNVSSPSVSRSSTSISGGGDTPPPPRPPPPSDSSSQPPDQANQSADGSRERGIEGDLRSRPNQPPSSAARQQALAIQQQHQQSGGASPIISQHGSAPDGKKLSGTSDASFDSHDSGDVPDGQRAQSHHRVSGKTNLAGRGFQPTPPLEVLKYRNAAATTAPAARTPDGTTSGLPETVHMAAPVVNKRDNSKSPISSRKAAWRSSTSKSSHAILSSSVVSSDASIGPTGMETRNAVTRSSGRAQTIVEVVSGGTVSGIGTRIVPSADGTGRAVTSPSEPTKVNVQEYQIDPPSRVVIQKVDKPVYTKSPTEEHARPLDRPDSAPPISVHRVFKPGLGRPAGDSPDDLQDSVDGHHGYNPGLTHRSQLPRQQGGRSLGASPVVPRKITGDEASPEVRRGNAISAVYQSRPPLHSAGDDAGYDNIMEDRVIHYDRKLRESELPTSVNDFSRYPHGKYPADATLPRSKGRKKRNQELRDLQREKIAAERDNDDTGDSLALAETLTGSESRSRNAIWLPDEGPEDDSDLEGQLEDMDGPVSFDADEFGDQVPMLSRNAPGRRSMSERRHTSLDAKKSEFYNQLQEKKKAGKAHSNPEGEFDGGEKLDEAGGAPAAVSALTPQTSRSSHRRAASLESLQAVLGLPDQTITENISNSPKARRLLGIHGEDSSQSNGVTKVPFQRRQSFEQSPSGDGPDGLGGELVRRTSSGSNTIQFGSKPAYSSKKSKKLFPGLSFLKTIGKRPRGMPAPLPLLQLPNADGATVSQKNSISPDATDTSSSSSQGLATHMEAGESLDTEDGDGSAVINHTGDNLPTPSEGSGSMSGGASTLAMPGMEDWKANEDEALISGCVSEIHLRGRSSMDQLRDEETAVFRSGSADDVRSRIQDEQLSPTSPPLSSNIPVILKETI